MRRRVSKSKWNNTELALSVSSGECYLLAIFVVYPRLMKLRCKVNYGKVLCFAEPTRYIVYTIQGTPDLDIV